MNVGEYNTFDLVKENTKKKTTVKRKNVYTIVFESQEKDHMYYSSPGTI
jgi:hypothetical protein